MKTIKFRAWDVKAKKMRYNFRLSIWDDMSGHLTTNDGDIDFDNDGEFVQLMQYTGLKDKNGVEIYEGDILKYFFLDNKKGIFITKVEWDTEASGFFAKGEDKNFGLDFCNADSVKAEVIGNIWEDKHLLENENKDLL